jgi:inorganic pyrophosphatase
MRVFIENEAGSTRKNAYDERTLLYLGSTDVSAAYPYPYGFVIGTIGGDGDAVDCFVLTQKPLKSGVAVECEPAGLLEQIEDGEIDHKVLAVLADEDARIGETAIAALKRFIAGVFAHVPGKRMQIGRVLDRAAAEEYLRQSREGCG